jgi:proline dehydrogenase
MMTETPLRESTPVQETKMEDAPVNHNTKGSESPSLDLMPAKYRHGKGHGGGGRRRGDLTLLNQLVVQTMPFVPKPLVKQFAKRYVAGETIPEMIQAVKELNSIGVSTTIDVLGEFIHHPEEAHQTAEMYKSILDKIQKYELNGNISVKLTALGLLLDKDLCMSLMRDLVSYAGQYNNFVRIDMEDSACTEDTIQLYLTLRQEFSNVGIVLQAYMRRTHDDALRIIDAGAGHFRLCKGIYVEPRWLAYQLPDLINQNYLEVLEEMIKRGAYVGIATHDERLVWGALKLIRKYNLRWDQYEFQMLLGVDPELRDMLIASGHHLRVYVPFGKQWHAYCMRRLKENPKIAGYILQNLFH